MRIATTVAPRAVRSIRSGHPWVYDHSVRTQKKSPTAGDLAVIFDDNDRFLAIGLADPHSPISIRILHHGSSATIDAGFFATKVDESVDRRQSLIDDPATTGYRLINGENDGLPGLVADRYGNVVVVKLYTTAWQPHLPAVLDQIEARCNPTAIVLRASRAVQAVWGGTFTDGQVERGTLENPLVRFAENGLTFTANVVSGNKTGHFLDQRDNRQAVRELSLGKSVLDVFSSTGGFSVYAAAGGATSVTSVDISPGAIAAAVKNMKSNDRSPIDGHETIVGDAFSVMDTMAEQRRLFDVVVVDPPSFAPKKADMDRARASYRRLTRAALAVLKPGGTLVQASCSARITEEMFLQDVTQELGRAGRRPASVSVTGHPIDHPVTFAEGRYLKAIFAPGT